MEKSQSIVDIVQLILAEERKLDLNQRDIALLAMVRDEIEKEQEGLLTVAYSTIQALSSRIDLLDVSDRDPQKAERRVSESMTRLLTAGCLSKADMVRLRINADTQYQLTSLGEAVSEWHVVQSRFSGEPLTAIFNSFINELSRIDEKAQKASTPEAWDVDVINPMQYALRDMLSSIHRHQSALDRQHGEMRQFIPELLTQNSEESIAECEKQLSLVIKTIDDLQESVLGSMSRVISLIEHIADLAKPYSSKKFDTVHDDIIWRLQSTSTWISQRAVDWMEHYNVVHGFLRTIVRVDRQRRVTDALKRAIAGPPGWTLKLANEPRFYRMRSDVVRDTTKRQPPRSKKGRAERTFEEIFPDDLPAKLIEHLLTDLSSNGEARASSLFNAIAPSLENALRLVPHFPWLVGEMLQVGILDTDTRDWRPVASAFEIEELRVKAK
ncbi:MAG: hypothetical protein FWD64_08760 [Acidobacteriaceae bacterium]|nr:hypothetical protein [Acidobacteriaceae bacterium]